ncbi:MAG: hypothetical protein ABH827_05930 [bacterium]
MFKKIMLSILLSCLLYAPQGNAGQVPDVISRMAKARGETKQELFVLFTREEHKILSQLIAAAFPAMGVHLIRDTLKPYLAKCKQRVDSAAWCVIFRDLVMGGGDPRVCYIRLAPRDLSIYPAIALPILSDFENILVTLKSAWATFGAPGFVDSSSEVFAWGVRMMEEVLQKYSEWPIDLVFSVQQERDYCLTWAKEEANNFLKYKRFARSELLDLIKSETKDGKQFFEYREDIIVSYGRMFLFEDQDSRVVSDEIAASWLPLEKAFFEKINKCKRDGDMRGVAIFYQEMLDKEIEIIQENFQKHGLLEKTE